MSLCAGEDGVRSPELPWLSWFPGSGLPSFAASKFGSSSFVTFFVVGEYVATLTALILNTFASYKAALNGPS